MPPEVKKFYKPRISTFMALLLVGATLLNWLLMLLLSLTGVGEIGSEILGFAQDFFLTLWLFLLHVYSGDRNRLAKLLSTLIPAVIEIIPFINDIPVGVIEILCLIVIVRREDRMRAEAKAIQAKKDAARMQQEQLRLNQLAYEAQMRAEAAREKALAVSIQVAQAPTNSRPSVEKTSIPTPTYENQPAPATESTVTPRPYANARRPSPVRPPTRNTQSAPKSVRRAA